MIGYLGNTPRAGLLVGCDDRTSACRTGRGILSTPMIFVVLLLVHFPSRASR